MIEYKNGELMLPGSKKPNISFGHMLNIRVRPFDKNAKIQPSAKGVSAGSAASSVFF